MRQHKHKGVERSNGSLRLHPVDRKHSTPAVMRYHNEEVKNCSSSKRTKPTKKKTAVKATMQRNIMAPIDKDGYVYINVEDYKMSSHIKGVRIKFTRKEGRSLRTVGLQIEK